MLKPCPHKHLKVKGVTQAIKVHGQCTVLWSVLDEAGMLRLLKVPALYIPDAKVKLLCVNSLGVVCSEESATFHPQGAAMSGVPGVNNMLWQIAHDTPSYFVRCTSNCTI